MHSLPFAFLCFVFIILTGPSWALDPAAPKLDGPSSTIYFETGNPGYEYTAANPLRIIHHKDAKHYSGPRFISSGPSKAALKPQVITVTIYEPEKYNKKKKRKYFTEFNDKSYKQLYKPLYKKVKQVTTTPAPYILKPYRPEVTVPPVNKFSSFGPKQVPPTSSQGPLNIPNLINKFGLVSLKPLLKPAIAREQAQPSLRTLEAALLETPFGYKEGEQFIIPLNNQPVPLKQVAFFIRQAQQGNEFLAVPPRAVIDSELVQVINENRQNLYRQKAVRRPKEDDYEINEIPEDYENDDQVESEEVESRVMATLQASSPQFGIRLLAPAFNTLPPKSRRFRKATLASLGYQ